MMKNVNLKSLKQTRTDKNKLEEDNIESQEKANNSSKQNKSDLYEIISKKSKTYIEEYQELIKAADFNDFELSEDDIKNYNTDEENVEDDMIDLQNKKKKASRIKKKEKDNKKYYDPIENERQVRLIEEKIEREIIEEERQHPFVSEYEKEDEVKAKRILEQDEFIREAYEKGVINREEIIRYIDYYELFSKINAYNKKVSNKLDEISVECAKEMGENQDNWKILKKKIESNFTSNKDMVDLALNQISRENNLKGQLAKNELFDSSIEVSKSFNPLKESQESTNQNSSTYNHNYKDESKPTHPPSTKSSKSRLKPIQNEPNLNKLNKIKKTNNEIDAMKASTSSIGSKKKLSSIRKCYDLYDENMKVVKTQATRESRKDFLASTYKSKNKGLFTFDSKKIQNNEDIKSNFLDMLEMPREMLENEKHMDPQKKTEKMRKINDAISFMRNKLSK